MFNLTEVTNSKLNVQLLAKDNTGQVSQLSGTKDENGETVLRIVDAAPFAYDPTTDRQKVSTVPSNATRKEQIFSGTIAASTGEDIYVEFQGESEVWVMVETDQQPWKMRTGSFLNMEGIYDNTFYPKIGSNQTAVHPSTSPMVALLMPLSVGASGAFPFPATFDEARRFPLSPGKNEFRFRFYNDSTTVANVKISILRVWK